VRSKDYEKANTLSDPDKRWWFALYTKPRSEFKAAEQINEAGIQYYLPSVTRVKQWSDRKKKVTEPLIKGYIFIYGNERERIISLEQFSVVRCLTERGRAAKIPDWQIENLKKMLSTQSDVIVKEGLIPGTRIRIKEGPFEGVIGILRETDNEKTLAVSIDLLNRSVLAHLSKESIIEIIKE
jgi:transcription antitermination factor NusG